MKSLLIVEDNSQDEKLMLRALGKVNLANRIDVVRDGQQALDYLFAEGEYAGRKGEEPPAIVLLDIGLPKLSGLEVLARIRSNPATCRIPVAMLTSSDEDCDRLKSYESGANSFVRKPIDFTRFAETVANMGVYWLMTNEPPKG
ncbi:MAG: response regulator [Burkholderiales bacterium]|nr:response regulator [Burkholderiales bacterium]